MSLKDLLEKTRQKGKSLRELVGNRPMSKGRSEDPVDGARSAPPPKSSLLTSRTGDLTPLPTPLVSLLLVTEGAPSALDLEYLATKQGHQVVRVRGVTEARDSLARTPFQVAVLWNDLSEEDAFLLAVTVRTTPGQTRILALLREENPTVRERLEKVGAHQVFAGEVTPTDVLDRATSSLSASPDLTQFEAASERQISILRNLLDTTGESRENLWLLGFAYYRARLFHDAIQTLTRLIERHPDDVQGHYYLGSCYFRTGQKERALARWRHVLIMAPDHAIARRARDHLDRAMASGSSSRP